MLKRNFMRVSNIFNNYVKNNNKKLYIILEFGNGHN